MTDSATGSAAPEADHQDRMIAAFARAVSTIAWEGPLQVVLDHLAGEVLAASSATTCTIALVSQFGDSVEVIGAAGSPSGFRDRVAEALSIGTPLASQRAFRSHARITQNIGELLASDVRFAPLVEITEQAGWRTLVTIPLLVRGEPVGVLTAFYSGSGEPTPAEVSFLTAMADHGAVAVNTARLLADAHAKAAQDERNRIARDIHDAISQSLFSMRLRTKALLLAMEQPADARGALLPGLHAMETIIDRAVDDMRALVMHLRPKDLADDDLAAAVRRHAETVSDWGAVLVEVQTASHLPTVSRRAQEEIYLIAREAIGNSVNHSRAPRLWVRMNAVWLRGTTHLVLEIDDDGIGFDPAGERPGHVGLDNMRDRAAELGGALTIVSSAEGTAVRLEVPIPPNAVEPPQ